MPLKTLNALEQDDYKSLPEATFIKGYYRSYAKYLNTDATAIIQRFDESLCKRYWAFAKSCF